VTAVCHILHGGWSLCGFSGDVPAAWPAGNVWCGTGDVDKVRALGDPKLCPKCEETYLRRKSFKESLGGVS
jgi:hypothetical protein